MKNDFLKNGNNIFFQLIMIIEIIIFVTYPVISLPMLYYNWVILDYSYITSKC